MVIFCSVCECDDLTSEKTVKRTISQWNYQSPLFALTCFVFIISISFSAFSVFCITSAAWKVKREVRKHDQTESQQINCTFIFFRGAETEHCCNSKFLTDLPWFQCKCRKAREFVRAHSCSLHYFLLDFSDRPLVEIVSTHRSNERKNKIKLMLKWSLHFCITTTVWWLAQFNLNCDIHISGDLSTLSPIWNIISNFGNFSFQMNFNVYPRNEMVHFYVTFFRPFLTSPRCLCIHGETLM